MILNTFSNLLSYRRPLELRDITGPVSSKIYSTRLFYNGHLQAGSIIAPFWNHSNEITRENGGSMGSMCTSQNHQRNKAKGNGTLVRLQRPGHPCNLYSCDKNRQTRAVESRDFYSFLNVLSFRSFFKVFIMKIFNDTPDSIKSIIYFISLQGKFPCSTVFLVWIIG